MPYRRGDVIAVPYDYSDLTGGKVRPAVIVTRASLVLAARGDPAIDIARLRAFFPPQTR